MDNELLEAIRDLKQAVDALTEAVHINNALIMGDEEEDELPARRTYLDGTPIN